MNSLLKTGTITLLTILVSFSAMVAFARPAIQVNAADKTVVFSHDRHIGLACATCHTATPSAAAPSFPVRAVLPPSCQSCHALADNTNESADSTKKCIDCHNDVAP